MVALRHATILQDAGYQVNLLSYYDTCTDFLSCSIHFPCCHIK